MATAIEKVKSKVFLSGAFGLGIGYTCVCDCGKTFDAGGHDLLTGYAKACHDCEHKKLLLRDHDGPRKYMAGGSYRHMIRRCYKVSHLAYGNYGARGIRVCDRWLGADGFANFLHDMGERPVGMTLDRIDPEGNYEPSNCRWADNATQQRNKRSAKNREHSALPESGPDDPGGRSG